MVNIDASLIIQIVNFVFLIWALNLILYKPIRDVLFHRKEKVAGFEQGIELCNKEAREKDNAYVLGIKEARTKGLKEKEGLLTSAADEERKIINKINEKAQANLAEVREKISKDAENVRVSLQQEIDKFADAISQKILGRPV